MRNAGQEEAQARIKIARRNINNLRCAGDTTLRGESKEELKSLLMKVRGERRSWLKTQHSENKDHGIRSHHIKANRMGKQWKQWQTLFSWAPKSLQMVTSAMKLKDAPWEKSYDKSRQHIKKQRHYFASKGLSSQSYIFSSSYVWKELDYKESWAPKNGYFWTAVLDKTLESPLGCKEIKPLNPKGNQSWIFIGRTDAEAEASILWPHDAKNWPWCLERLKAGGEGNDRGWDGWMASPTRWTCVWVSSGS